MLGLSQVPIPAAAVVVGWLLAMGWREKTLELGGSGLFNFRQFVLFGWTGVAGIVVIAAIYEGLLGAPEMQVTGNGSTAYLLRWFDDRTEGPFPTAWVFSVPMLVYRGAMLAWSLWLALALLKWIKWAWGAFSAGGLWRKPAPVTAAPKPPA